MTKFNKYIIKLFVQYTVIVQVFVAIITLIANTFQHTKMLSEYNISFMTLIVYDLMKTPYLLYTTMPMTIVISTMLVMVTLLKNNELIAYVSLGGKIRNLAYPFIVSGIFLSVLLYFSADVINPKIMLERERFAYENIKNRTFNVSGKLTDMWLKESDSSFININLMDPTEKKIIGITEYHLNNNFQVDYIVTYDSAEYYEGKWIEKNKKVFAMDPVPVMTDSAEEVIQERELFDELTSLPVLSPKFLSLKEVRRTAEIMKKQDINTAKYYLQLYKSYAHALSVIVIILVIFPLCIGFNRNHSYIAVASKSLFTGFAYWMLMASFQSLGKTGLFSPLAANFIPIGAFFILALALIYRRERAL
ncbi:permease YjgP/YjgQ family protein [Denitrovibrio acetiphilus DSM 12809]|uniref:Permease YjgP/YjgQ family protein n=1 Tax=Denitrovibrio acetiphilus (strain DSM 12809 / NBRC 114555 / N2460) TaxID=522772 RepID=D4H8C5_DENA2|nr:LptF/LptG family permease [Denitrovibrio acetiphilus]ADD68274.1 permease YjgP/YjgQ family protein [Denitrovibrio acetiphilus DSM 12809]